MQFERFAKVALSKKEYKEALHYTNQLLNVCTDSMKFIGLKIEVFITWNKLPEALEFTTKI